MSVIRAASPRRFMLEERSLALSCAGAIALVVVLAMLAAPARGELTQVREIAHGDVLAEEGLGIDASGTLYVAGISGGPEQFKKIRKYSPQGQQLGTVDLGIAGEWMYHLAVDRDGTIYFITETQAGDPPGLGRIYKVAPGGGSPELLAPRGFFTDIAVGPDSLYVGESPFSTDTFSNRVLRLSKSGALTGTWNLPGLPNGLAVDNATGDVYVGLIAPVSVARYTANGSPLAAWGRPGAEPGVQSSPGGIAPDGAGHVWVAYGEDPWGCKSNPASCNGLQLFTNTGAFLKGWSHFGGYDDMVIRGPSVFVARASGPNLPPSFLSELRDLALVKVRVEAKWKQKSNRVVVSASCNVLCSLQVVEGQVKGGKKWIGKLPGREDKRVTAKRRDISFRLSKKLRKRIAKAQAHHRKVRVFVDVYAAGRFVDGPEASGTGADDACQSVAIPRHKAKKKKKLASAGAKCLAPSQRLQKDGPELGPDGLPVR